jgi:DNA-binding PadR family transcriptional regulator
MPPKAEDYLPLSNLSFHILLTLGNGASHGYAIGRDVEQRSAGRLNPTTGALYQALKRLDQDGLIAPAPAPSSEVDARRHYFRLTPLGRRVTAREAQRLESLVAAAREASLYQGKG